MRFIFFGGLGACPHFLCPGLTAPGQYRLGVSREGLPDRRDNSHMNKATLNLAKLEFHEIASPAKGEAILLN